MDNQELTILINSEKEKLKTESLVFRVSEYDKKLLTKLSKLLGLHPSAVLRIAMKYFEQNLPINFMKEDN